MHGDDEMIVSVRDSPKGGSLLSLPSAQAHMHSPD